MSEERRNVNETSVSELADVLLPVMTSPSIALKFNQQTAKLTLVNAEPVIQSLKERADIVSKFVYQEADRQQVRKLRTAANKLKQGINAKIRAQKSHIFDDVDTQKSEMFEYLDQIIDNLDAGMDKFDRMQKEQKEADLKDKFENLLSAMPELDQTGVQFSDVENHRWTNRSYSANKAMTEMTDRLKTLSALKQSPILNDVKFADILDACQYHEWDGLQAQNYILEQKKEAEEAARRAEAEAKIQEQMRRDREAEQARKEQEALEEAHQKEAAEQAGSKLIDLKLKINAGDRQTVIDLFDQSGIWYSLSEGED